MESPISNSSTELKFQPPESTETGAQQLTNADKQRLMAGNIQRAFAWSDQEMESLFTNEHFNHQY